MKIAAMYQNTLFLIPEEFDSFSSFVSEVEKHPMQVVITLKEKDSLVPYFISEHCEVKTLVISHPEMLIETEVDVFSREEYNSKLLSKMKEMRFPELELERYRDILTLDGTLIRKYSFDSYHASIMDFWSAFTTIEEKLRSELDDQCVENDEIRLMLFVCGMIPYDRVRVFLRKLKGKYIMMITCFSDTILQIVLDGLIHYAPEKLRKHWIFHSYLPKNVYQYVASSEDYDVSKTPCALRIQPMKFDHLSYEVEFQIEPYSNESFAWSQNYLYMCSVLGENVFHAVVKTFSMNYTTKKDGISVQEFERQLMASRDPMILIQIAGHMHQIPLHLKKQENFSERSFEQHVMTRCTQCTLWFVHEKPSDLIELLLTKMRVVFCTLVFTVRDDMERKDQYKHILVDLMRFLVEKAGVQIIDYCLSEGRIDVDFMCFDSSKFFNLLRRNAPMFMMYNCRYDEYTDDGCTHYEVSYQMKKKSLSFEQLH